MAKRQGLIPLREKTKELERAYLAVQKEIAQELASLDMANYQEIRTMRVQAKTDALIRRLNRKAIKWVKESVPMAYKKSYLISKTRLEILGVEKDKEFNKKKHRFSVEDYIEKTMDDLIKANQSIKVNVAMYLYLARQASLGIMQIQEFGAEDETAIENIISQAVERGERPGYATNLIRDYFKAKTRDGQFILINGRNYNLKNYSKLVARTRMRQVQSEAVKNTCEQYGNDLVKVSDHNSEYDDRCLDFEGKVFSLSGGHPLYPLLDTSPPWHPNCRHNILPTSEEAIEWDERPAAPPGVPRMPEITRKWKPMRTMAEAEKWGKQYGIEGIVAEGKRLTLKEWNLIAKEMSKLPDDLLRTVKANGGSIDLVIDSGITVHPSFAHLKGQTPRGWTTGTWDNVPGAGGTQANPKTVIVANKTGVGHGSTNLVLHEYGHTVDAIAKKGWKNLSDSSGWQKIWKTNGKKGLIDSPYQTQFAEEYWAESFAEFFDSPGHGYLPKNVITYFNNLFKGG